jgi:pimeloyl-ACP methyl ester carboxylesterase
MKKMLSIFGFSMGTIVLILVSLFSVFAQRDIPVEKLKIKYCTNASQFMPLMGMNVHYRDQGARSDTLPLVLIHGTSSSLNTWDSLTNLLSANSIKNKRIIRMDMPGFGLTGPSPENAYSYAYFSMFLDSFLNKLQVKSCILAGNSLGGGIAWNYTLAHPEKVKKLILIDASGYPRKDEKGSIGFKIASIPVVNNLLLFITPKALVKKSLETVFFDKSFITEATITRYHDLLLSEGNRKATLSLFQHPLKQNTAAIININTPTLILWGEQDQLISVANAYQFQKDIKGSILEVYKGVGHIPMEEAPSLMATSVLDFIK